MSSKVLVKHTEKVGLGSGWDSELFNHVSRETLICKVRRMYLLPPFPPSPPPLYFQNSRNVSLNKFDLKDHIEDVSERVTR